MLSSDQAQLTATEKVRLQRIVLKRGCKKRIMNDFMHYFFALPQGELSFIQTVNGTQRRADQRAV